MQLPPATAAQQQMLPQAQHSIFNQLTTAPQLPHGPQLAEAATWALGASQAAGQPLGAIRQPSGAVQPTEMQQAVQSMLRQPNTTSEQHPLAGPPYTPQMLGVPLQALATGAMAPALATGQEFLVPHQMGLPAGILQASKSCTRSHHLWMHRHTSYGKLH